MLTRTGVARTLPSTSLVQMQAPVAVFSLARMLVSYEAQMRLEPSRRHEVFTRPPKLYFQTT